MKRLANGMLATTRCRSRCSEKMGPSRRETLVGVIRRTFQCLRADFFAFRFVSDFRRRQPLVTIQEFFPTGHLKRNAPPRRNEMPSRNARENRRRGRAGICAIPAVKKNVRNPGMASGKKNLRATWRAPVLPPFRRSGGCRRMSPCPETPCPFCGSGPADRGVDQGTRFYRSRPVRRGQHHCCRGRTVCDGPGRGNCATPGFIRTDVGMPVADDRIDMCRTGPPCNATCEARPGTTPWTALPCPPS